MMDNSRKNALSHLRKNLRSGRGEELPMKKVSVMSDSEEGLEEGLSKAKELMESGIIEKVMKPEQKMSKMSKMEDEMESLEHEDMESSEYESGEEEAESEMEKAPEDMSREELIAMVKKHKEMMNQ